MKILLLCHRFPFPVDGGGKIRALKIIEYLSRKYDLHVLSMIRNEEELESRHQLSLLTRNWTAPTINKLEVIWSLLIGLIKGQSLSESYFCTKKVRNSIPSLLKKENFDLIIVHSSSMGRLVLDAHIPKIIDFCDMDSKKWELFANEKRGLMRWVYKRESVKIRELEKQLSESFDSSSVATPLELKQLKEISSNYRAAFCFTNGVDLEYFRPKNIYINNHQFCFVGRMDYLPNIKCVNEFIYQCWPDIKRSIPAAKFVIVGANPSKDVKLLQRIDGVQVTGTVADVRPFLERSTAMVAPLRIARGVQNKILESMAMGVPVVTSAICAEALPPSARESVIICNEPAEVVAACLALARDDDFRSCKAKMGQQAIRNVGEWGSILTSLEFEVLKLVEQSTPSSAHIR